MWNLVTYSVILLSLATAERFPSITKTCGQDETCESKDTCKWVREKYEQVKTAANGDIKLNIVNQLKAAVCNKAKKAFCCPQIRDCGRGETCKPKETCKWARDKYQEAKINPNRKQSIINQLKAAVCDKANKKFCCPEENQPLTIDTRTDEEDTDTDGTYLPSTQDTDGTYLPSPEDTDGTYLPSPSQCGGKKNEFVPYMIGGEEVDPGEFPFMALLGYSGICKRKESKVRCTKYLCGGTLINRRYILTAAHCSKGGKRQRRVKEIVLGEWDVNTNPDESLPRAQKFQVSKTDVTLHPGYGKGEGRNNPKINDIALIRLPRLADLNAGTGMVCLPLGATALSNLGIPNLSSGLLSTSPTVAGWGYTSYNPWQGDYQEGFGEQNGNVASSTPFKLSHVLLSNSDGECRGYNLLESQICGDLRRGQGACQGDSGSGLYLNGSRVQGEGGAPWYQVGIVSFGSLYCDSGKPVIYTRISSYLQWIKQNIKP